MSTISDFTDAEVKTVSDTLQERYAKPIEIQQADIELRIHPEDRELTECPAIYWEEADCHFILCKTPAEQFYSQFFYSNQEQFGTGIKYYDDLLDCLVTTLRVQADHELEKNKVKDIR